MSADITPADLAKFVHRVPKGATIPAGMAFCWVTLGGQITGPTVDRYNVTQGSDATCRWTAKPILTPEQQRLEDEYAAACESILTAERAAAKAREEAEALRLRADHLYRELRKAGRR